MLSINIESLKKYPRNFIYLLIVQHRGKVQVLQGKEISGKYKKYMLIGGHLYFFYFIYLLSIE